MFSQQPTPINLNEKESGSKEEVKSTGGATPSTTVKDSSASVTSSSQSTQQERVLITGDDILIEYVERLMNEIKNVDEGGLKPSWKTQIEKFITHYVWHSQDPVTNEKIKHGQRYTTPFWVRLQGRLNEMQERRRRLIKYLYKKEGKLNEFEAGF
jgi:anti-sigma28 factor (negative regulator of flagellin synthesis)